MGNNTFFPAALYTTNKLWPEGNKRVKDGNPERDPIWELHFGLGTAAAEAISSSGWPFPLPPFLPPFPPEKG